MNIVISEERLTKLIIRIVKSMSIKNLYRVQLGFPKNGEVIIALFFETVSSSEYYAKIKNNAEDLIKNLLGLESIMVLTIPYSEAKYHLNKPKNI